MTGEPRHASGRPPVTVVLPFHGSAAEAGVALAELERLRLRAGDAALLVDNTEEDVTRSCSTPEQVRVLSSPVKRSAYAARNFGAELAQTDWILFVDADCRLVPDLLDRYFDPPPADRAGAVAGQVTGTPGQQGLVPAYIRSRRHLDQSVLQDHPYRPMAVTANLLVRRAAWLELGGFAERTRSGADNDFCWRLLDAGWTLEYRDGAAVTHDHRAGIRALLEQARRDGAGGTWLARRFPGHRPLMGPREFLRAVAGAIGWPLLGRPRRGLFKAIDAVWGAALDIGALASNAPPSPPGRSAELIALLEEFPVAGDPLVAGLARQAETGAAVRVEARRRPERCDWTSARRVNVDLWEDDAPLARLTSALRPSLRVRRRLPPELGPPARRLALAAPGARVLADAAMLETARLLARAAGRPDLHVDRIADRAEAAVESGTR